MNYSSALDAAKNNKVSLLQHVFMVQYIGYISHYCQIYLLAFVYATSVTDAISHLTRNLVVGAARKSECNFAYFDLHENKLRSEWRNQVTSLTVGENDTEIYLLPWFLAKEPESVPMELLHGVRCSLTASNPLGQVLPHQVNLARNQELRVALENMQPRPSQIVNTWSMSRGGPKELGYSVAFNDTDAGSGLQALEQLGRQYCQAALYCYHAEGSNLIMDVVPCWNRTAAVSSQVDVVAVPKSEADPHGFEVSEPVPEA